MTDRRTWTIYLAQDKHLDYNWCGSTAEIEVRMAALLDGYLALAEQDRSRWNLDGTLWLDVYRRQRGEAGAQRLLDAIRQRRIGYAANQAVLLWGLLSAEQAIRACAGSLPIARATGTANRTALVIENPGLSWNVALILSACGIGFLGRGIYALRAESYAGQREPYPLFWWQSPDGARVLVRWDLYEETRAWGGYAEAFRLAEVAGEGWDAFHVQTCGDRNSPEVYRQRAEYIHRTVQRYEAYGDAYPISSILLLGSGWDNWTITGDVAAFVRRFNADSDGTIQLVDARYDEFFEAAAREIQERDLALPTLSGSFGICWEEWAAHLAGPTAAYREADRLLRQAEAAYALAWMNGQADPKIAQALVQGADALLRFAEHDFGGCDRATAAISAGVRAAAATEALSLSRSLCPRPSPPALPRLERPIETGSLTFAWRGGSVRFDPERCAVASLVDAAEREWVPQSGLGLGEFVRTLYRSDGPADAVFPAAISTPPETDLDRLSCRRGANGVEVQTEGRRWGFEVSAHWFFYAAQPWVDVVYDLAGGWTDAPQSVQICFPLNLADPVYRYDMGGAILVAGPVADGGDDLPGANPALWAAQSFAATYGRAAGAILLTLDAPLVQFGARAVQVDGVRVETVPAALVSMPMMNLTRNDRQFGQGGERRWRFRYRLILTGGQVDPLRPLSEAQRFGVPPYLCAPGTAPWLPEFAALDVAFDGGPVTALKVGEDGQRLILRLWNVRDRPVKGMLRLPAGFVRAQRCDALERPLDDLPVTRGRVAFAAQAYSLLTIALCRK
jgi:hypothetical protein